VFGKFRSYCANGNLINGSIGLVFPSCEHGIRVLPYAGLAQGSPLSLISFVFFNADLVDQTRSDTQGGSLAHTDFYRWRTGNSAEEYLSKVQDGDIPRNIQWVYMITFYARED